MIFQKQTGFLFNNFQKFDRNISKLENKEKDITIF